MILLRQGSPFAAENVRIGGGKTAGTKPAGSFMLKNKNAIRAAGIPAAAFAVALALTLAGCPMGTGFVERGSSAPLGEILRLGGQVYLLAAPGDTGGGKWVWDYHAEAYKWVPDSAAGSPTAEYTAFDGNRGIFSRELQTGRQGDYNWEGFIGGGRLFFAIGTPPRLSVVGTDRYMLFEGYHYTYDDFTISPRNARGAVLRGLDTEGDGFSGRLVRQNLDAGGGTSVLDEVYYIYVDQNVAVSGRGHTVSDAGYAVRLEDINIRLEKGWNVMHVRSVAVETEDGFFETISITAADPYWVRWKLWEIKDGIPENGETEASDLRRGPLRRSVLGAQGNSRRRM